MLDEPLLGLAPLIAQQVFKLTKEIHQEGVTVLLIEQNAKLALSCARYGYIMESGRIVMDAPSGVLTSDLDIKEFYLGLTDGSRRKNYADVKHYKRRKRWLS